jgi:hypothetical protein
MKKTAISTILLGAALAAQSPAFAQNPPPPPQVTHPGATAFNNEYNTKVLMSMQNQPVMAYSMAKKVAGCLAARGKADAGSLVGGTMSADANFNGLTQALTKKYKACVTQDAVGVPMAYINGALAEELVVRQHPALQDRAPTADAAAKSFYTDAAGVTMDTLGRCLAVYSPGLAYRVLATTAGTASETQALASLYSQTPECGVSAAPAGIPAVEQRASVAAGLYHWTHRG